MRFAALPSVALAVLLVGCSSISTHREEAQGDLRTHHQVYVQSAANDSAQLDELMAAELRRLGYAATAGVRTMRPDSAGLVLSYESRWEWDFRQYLIELQVRVSDARTGKLLARGRILHPGVTRKTPAEMIREVLAPLFAPGPN